MRSRSLWVRSAPDVGSGAHHVPWKLGRHKVVSERGPSVGLSAKSCPVESCLWCVARHIYKQEATGHLGTVDLLSVADRAIEPSYRKMKFHM